MTTITIRFQIPGFHNWPDAPDKYSYLRNKHRHTFYFEAEIKVNHDNRDVEFVDLKHQLMSRFLIDFQDEYGLIETEQGYCDFGYYSCEMLAKELFLEIETVYSLQPIKTSVFEDNENGASYYGD